MRKVLHISFLLLGFLSNSKAQPAADLSADSLFNHLLNHTPKHFVSNEATKPRNPFLQLNLTTIGALQTVFGAQKAINLNEAEVEWLREQTDQMALAFYAEGNPLFIRQVGGYEGCQGKRVSKENLRGQMVTVLYFCFPCSGAGQLEDFFRIFNDRTAKLLN